MADIKIVKNILIDLFFLLLLLSCIIMYTSVINDIIQNQIIYGRKLIASSEIKVSRKKYNKVISIIVNRSNISILFFI